ncbi:hypothetical protein F5Y17DRAFT_44554 [Xylariaceae sp. FL0594]|nr:hypothetical protein F5Y17DRAFT_44554 [Xylariaceae sp. FL0594]
MRTLEILQSLFPIRISTGASSPSVLLMLLLLRMVTITTTITSPFVLAQQTTHVQRQVYDDFSAYPQSSQQCLYDSARAAGCVSAPTGTELNLCLCHNQNDFVYNSASCLGREGSNGSGSGSGSGITQGILEAVYQIMSSNCAGTGVTLSVPRDSFLAAANAAASASASSTSSSSSSSSSSGSLSSTTGTGTGTGTGATTPATFTTSVVNTSPLSTGSATPTPLPPDNGNSGSNTNNNSNNTGDSGSLSTGTKAGVGVGVSFGAIAAALAAWFIWAYQKRHHHHRDDMPLFTSATTTTTLNHPHSPSVGVSPHYHANAVRGSSTYHDAASLEILKHIDEQQREKDKEGGGGGGGSSRPVEYAQDNKQLETAELLASFPVPVPSPTGNIQPSSHDSHTVPNSSSTQRTSTFETPYGKSGSDEPEATSAGAETRDGKMAIPTTGISSTSGEDSKKGDDTPALPELPGSDTMSASNSSEVHGHRHGHGHGHDGS